MKIRKKPEENRWLNGGAEPNGKRIRGEASKRVKARNLHGTVRPISDAHKREGACVMPGEICTIAEVLPASRGDGMIVQKSAEAIACAG